MYCLIDLQLDELKVWLDITRKRTGVEDENRIAECIAGRN